MARRGNEEVGTSRGWWRCECKRGFPKIMPDACEDKRVPKIMSTFHKDDEDKTVK